MELRIQGPGPTAPFLSAKDLFETEHDLSMPVYVRFREDPDARTWVSHDENGHVLTMAKQTANGVMARELALHEFAHMARHEEEHPSHVQSMEEALYLAFTGQPVERRKFVHCYQIANHMKDIYADDITLSLDPGEKLLSFLESSLASAVADRPSSPFRKPSQRVSETVDPDITAINAAFAIALAERHDLIDGHHRMYDLAHAAAMDAPSVDIDWFVNRFRTLDPDPDRAAYRRYLVDVARAYALSDSRT